MRSGFSFSLTLRKSVQNTAKSCNGMRSGFSFSLTLRKSIQNTAKDVTG